MECEAELMTEWTISYDGKSCQPTLTVEKVQQDTPTLGFSIEDKNFTVEFKNRSDYMASRHGSVADVIIVSGSRTKRVAGSATNKSI
jgi:hypothetical protein